MLDIDLERTYGELKACYGEMDEALGWSEDELFGTVPEVSGWSPAAHFFHLAVANGLVFKSIRLIAAGRGKEGEGPNRYGLICLTQGRLPRGRGIAPERTRPPEDLDLAALRVALQRNHAALADIEPLLPSFLSYPGQMPHPLLGSFDASQWLLFARIHTRHHLGIVSDIRTPQSSKSTS